MGIKSITSEIRIRRCYGCGAPLQSENPKVTGYIPAAKLQAGEEGLCERCYRLQHYNEMNDIPHFNDDYYKILEQAKKEDALIVLVLDLFAFEASIINDIGKHLYDKTIIILNKKDILPREIKEEKILEYAKARIKKEGIKYKNILVTSHASDYNLDLVLETIQNTRNGKNVYFLGASSVGKSSIINSFLKVFKNETKRFITTSTYPGTTLDIISIPLDNDSNVYDTPGIYNDEAIINHLDRSTLKYIVPRNEIKTRLFQLQDAQSLLLGGVAKFDFLEGKKTTFSLVMSNDITIVRSKLDKSEKVFANLIKENNLKPISVTISSIEDLERKEVFIPNTSSMVRILIIGLGYIDLIANEQKIAIYVPKKVGIKVVTLA